MACTQPGFHRDAMPSRREEPRSMVRGDRAPLCRNRSRRYRRSSRGSARCTARGLHRRGMNARWRLHGWRSLRVVRSPRSGHRIAAWSSKALRCRRRSRTRARPARCRRSCRWAPDPWGRSPARHVAFRSRSLRASVATRCRANPWWTSHTDPRADPRSVSAQRNRCGCGTRRPL